MPSRAADGSGLFTQNCLMCHQAGAVGLPGQFPRLAGRIAAISSQPKGRAYLIDVLTYGMAGESIRQDWATRGTTSPLCPPPKPTVAAGVLFRATPKAPPPTTPP